MVNLQCLSEQESDTLARYAAEMNAYLLENKPGSELWTEETAAVALLRLALCEKGGEFAKRDKEARRLVNLVEGR